MSLMVLFGVVCVLSLLLLLGSKILGKFSSSLEQIVTPFECGFESFNMARVNFSVQFFLLMLLFLIFDVEIILLLMFPFLKMLGLEFLLGASILILILWWGSIVEWKKGYLAWF